MQVHLAGQSLTCCRDRGETKFRWRRVHGEKVRDRNGFTSAAASQLNCENNPLQAAGSLQESAAAKAALRELLTDRFYTLNGWPVCDTE